MASKWNDERPMAPHLQIWRWHPAMMSSILHRAVSIITYAALIKVALGLYFLMRHGSLPLEGLLYSPLGALGLCIGLFAVIFMALAQLRHLIWDRGGMFDPDLNNMLSYVMIALSLIGAVILTLIATGRL